MIVFDQQTISAWVYPDVADTAGAAGSGDQQVPAEGPADGLESDNGNAQLDGERVHAPVAELGVHQWEGIVGDQQHCCAQVLIRRGVRWKWVPVPR
ncbi:MAG TPA: hypothetical protein VFC16_05450 [Nakamurella sp.]|nr:hypothetical protein [Nakamurella sp.]